MVRALCLMLVCLAACTAHVEGPSSHGLPGPSPLDATQQPEPSHTSAPLAQSKPQPVHDCVPCNLAQSAAEVSSCYHLVPGQPAQKDKRGKTITPGTMCQPQSLIYARCRSGIHTCKLGNTSPEGWFACAARQGATSGKPQAGSVMVFAANARRKMYTGHPVYVEEVCPQKDGSWRLRISHTNYDRRCHLDHNAWVHFFPQTMTASFETGPWAAWAKNLRVLGFILR